MVKVCSKCKVSKDMLLFYKNKNTGDGLTSYCKVCMNEVTKPWKEKNKRKSHTYSNNWRQRNPHRTRSHQHSKYWPELTPNERVQRFNELHDSQGRCCAICKDEDAKLNVDHDHLTGQIRGLLCGKCNTALGLFRDSTEFLRTAAEYLDKATGPG